MITPSMTYGYHIGTTIDHQEDVGEDMCGVD